MAEILDYFDRINIDVAKRKYYNVNKVNSVLEELHSLAVELVDENERQRQELIQLREQLGQRTADGQQSRELLNSMQSLYRDTLAKAHSRADGIVQEAEIQRDKLAKETKAEREYAEEQVRECFRVLQAREEENLRFLHGYLDRFTSGIKPLNTETEAAHPTETIQTEEQCTVQNRQPRLIQQTATAEEDEEEDLPSDGITQLKDLELQIRRLADEISALESGR